jgi:hypothetical protein
MRRDKLKIAESGTELELQPLEVLLAVLAYIALAKYPFHCFVDHQHHIHQIQLTKSGMLVHL